MNKTPTPQDLASNLPETPAPADFVAMGQELVGQQPSIAGLVEQSAAANNFRQAGAPAIIIALVELAKLARNDDQEARAELRRHGELLALAGGFEAMEKIAGLVHDYEIAVRPTPYRLSPTIISIWENIPEWANA